MHNSGTGLKNTPWPGTPVGIFGACPPKGVKGFIPVGPRPTECVLHPRVNANNKLLANFAEKTLEDGTKPKMEIWVVNLGEAFNVRRRIPETGG